MTPAEIITATLRELPVGNVQMHTPESIPERVRYYVREYLHAMEQLTRIQNLVTTEHETKEQFIERVRRILFAGVE